MTRARARRRTLAGARLELVLATAILASGCADSVDHFLPTPARSTPEASAGAPSSPAATPPPVETLAPPSPAGPVVEDPSLLAVLPAAIGAVPVTLEPQAFAESASDSAFARTVEAAAFAVVVEGEDLASAVVARPIGGTLSEAQLRDWRDSYDEGACGQAGGVARTAEAEIGGRTVSITTCAGGLRTYHAWVEERGVIVSAFSLGEGRFGEQLMAGLRP